MSESTFAKETTAANLEHEMRRSYLDYAMSVIVGRALPDVRDGLKPVHRRVLYAMTVLGNDSNKPYKKSARVVGDVIGKYHPHGDTAVYDAIVRMAQHFSMRYPLVDGQGNFGSIDGDSPAAMRYTEIRLAKIAHELLSDLDKDTVDFGPNYDETETQPLALPTRVPNLLVNGSTGIAVGMATNVPPHNLRETIAATLALIADPDISVAGLMAHVPGPDFPTAGIINGRAGIRQAYETGRGRIQVRARATIEPTGKKSSKKPGAQADVSSDSATPAKASGRESIIVHELPYQVNKARLMEKIADLVKNKRIEGISGLRDESDKSGMRMVIELRRGEQAEVTLNNLYKLTQMQTVFGINMVALGKNQPRLFNLKEALDEFVKHRREVVTRRSLFELRKARERAHILEGLAVALANIDAVIKAIKAARTPAAAKASLLSQGWDLGAVAAMLARGEADLTRPEHLDKPLLVSDASAGDGGESTESEHGESTTAADKIARPPVYGAAESGYWLSPPQAQAILDLRLHRLTGLEHEKIHREYGGLIDDIIALLAIVRNPARLMEVISEELSEIQRRYGDPRRTEIVETEVDLSTEDLIAEQEVVVTLSHVGYAKSQPVADYSAQRRGGKGRIAAKTRQEDFVERMFVANSHDTLLCFSDRGKVYWLRVFQLPQAGRQARGKPLVNLLALAADEQVTAILPIQDYPDGQYVVMATARGVVKKCSLDKFARPRSSGLIAVSLDQDDHLIGATLATEAQDIMLFSNAGKAARFAAADTRAIGRTGRGVRGIRLGAGERVIALLAAPAADGKSADAHVHVDGESADTAAANMILLSTVNGYGKRTPIAEFSRRNRGGKGMIAIKTSPRNGEVVSALLVSEDDEVMLITDRGILIRTRAAEISIVSRNTQGVRLIKLQADERLVSVGKVDENTGGDGGDGDDGDDGDGDGGDSNVADSFDDSPTTDDGEGMTLH